MTDTELIRNCVRQYRKPFNAALIAGLTGIDIKAVQHALTDLETSAQIKCISKTESIYVRANRYSRPSNPDNLPWAVYPEKAIPLLNLIARQPFTNGRKMAKALGKSHQWVYVYLKALKKAGVVIFARRDHCMRKWTISIDNKSIDKVMRTCNMASSSPGGDYADPLHQLLHRRANQGFRQPPFQD